MGAGRYSPKARSGPATSGVALLDGAAGLDREPVDEVVHLVPGMPLDPSEADVPTISNGDDERLPQVAVRHRLLRAVHPAAAQPAPPPGVPEAVHDVGRVADDGERTVQRPHRLERRPDLHPLVRGLPLAAARLPAVLRGPRPAPGAGVTGARAVRPDLEHAGHGRLGCARG